MSGDPEVLGAGELQRQAKVLIRAAISDAYYESRNDGETMEHAADVAAEGVWTVLEGFDGSLLDVARDSRPVGEGLREAIAEVFEPYLRLAGIDDALLPKVLDGATARLAAYHGLQAGPAAVRPATEDEDGPTPLSPELRAMAEGAGRAVDAVFGSTQPRAAVRPATEDEEEDAVADLLNLLPGSLGDDRDIQEAVAKVQRLSRAAVRPVEREGLDAAWAEAEATRPDGWIFHGVDLADHSMDGGGWGPDWIASMSWPDHCEWDDCDHDAAFRVGSGATPEAALRALARLPESVR